jgi:DnaJ-class molecular chaperone
MGKDYYKILGLARSASPEDIRNAYLRLARTTHPDLKKDPKEKEEANARFQDISEAFEILSHPTRKKIYDKGGEEALTAGGKRTTTGPIRPGQNRGIPPNSANRLAAQFFGFGIHGLDPTTGAPLGGNNVPTKMGIPGFNLSGFTGGQTVTSANGMRTTTYTRSTPQRSQQPKPQPPPKPSKRPVLLPLECTYEELFTGCEKDVQWDAYEDGEHITKEVTIDVKSGWMVGQKIEVEDGNDEVTIIVTETPHDTFKRKKDDLYYECDITIDQALCGGEIIIPTIVKGKNLKLKFGGTINTGFVHEIPGHGMPIVDTDDRGKLIVTFTVKLPTKLSKDQRERIGAILRE